MWQFHNDSLRAIANVRFEIVSARTFDAKKLAFREPIKNEFYAYWSSVREIPSGELTKPLIFVAIEEDHLRLGRSARMNEIRWATGDLTGTRRWLLKMRVVGLSAEWTIELDLRWTSGTKDLVLIEYPPASLIPDKAQTEVFRGNSDEKTNPMTLPPSPAKRPKRPSRKGDISLLQKGDGTRYTSVDFPTAETYAGIRSRRRQQLMKDGILKAAGRGKHRRITVESLLDYFPPIDNAQLPEAKRNKTQ